jgi:mevalonate kinase
MGIGSGFGKVILFGEHFVVHGAPAIAAGLDRQAVVEVVESDATDIITEHKVIPDMSRAAISAVLDSMKISKKYNVYLKGDLPTFGGLGSSAAFCVALVRALADEFSLNLSEEEINQHAYSGERTFHGNPSGIDNYLATYGGVRCFRRNDGKNKAKALCLGSKLHLVVSFSGKFSDTVGMVDLVRRRKESDPEGFALLLEKFNDLETRAEAALENGDLSFIGSLMNDNNELLSDLDLLIDENKKIISTALASGALGSKVTGGGGGGCCISLAEDQVMATSIRKTLDIKGFPSFVSVVG